MFKSYEEMIEELEREMRRVSGDVILHGYRISGASNDIWSPKVDVYETEDVVVVKVGVAGLEPNQMDLTLSSDNKYLTLRGVRVEHDTHRAGRIRYHQLEIYYGPFERVVGLPADVPIDRDKLSATYKDGFLKVVLPKRPDLGTKKVDIV